MSEYNQVKLYVGKQKLWKFLLPKKLLPLYPIYLPGYIHTPYMFPSFWHIHNLFGHPWSFKGVKFCCETPWIWLARINSYEHINYSGFFLFIQVFMVYIYNAISNQTKVWNSLPLWIQRRYNKSGDQKAQNILFKIQEYTPWNWHHIASVCYHNGIFPRHCQYYDSFGMDSNLLHKFHILISSNNWDHFWIY